MTPERIGFEECETCRAKPGSPLLCAGCRHNRVVIAAQASTIAQLQQAEKMNTYETLKIITELKDALAHITKELRAVKVDVMQVNK